MGNMKGLHSRQKLGLVMFVTIRGMNELSFLHENKVSKVHNFYINPAYN